MKPFEIEIFDRKFNFRSNALIDKSAFSYAFDALSIEKFKVTVISNTLTIREVADSGTPGDDTVACSDYIRIIANETEYYGIIMGIEENGTTFDLSCVSLYKLLDHECLIVADDIKHTSIEAYIKLLIDSEFIGNNDEWQDIENLTVTTSSTTTGIFDYNDTPDIYVVINLLDNLIYPAFREYLVYTDVSIDFSAKTVNVSIGEIPSNSKTIEADLQNVISKTFNIRNTSDDTNKLVLVDTAKMAMSEYNFYLHPSDYSFDNVDNNDRFYPVINKIHLFDSDAVTEEEFLEVANESARAIRKYVDIERDLSDAEYAELSQGISDFLPYLIASKTAAEWEVYFKEVGEAFNNIIWSSWYGFSGNGFTRVSSYGDLEEEGAYHYYFQNSDTSSPSGFVAYKQKQNVSGAQSTYTTYPDPSAMTAGGWGTTNFSGNVFYNTNTHASFITQVTFKEYTVPPNDDGIHTFNLITNVYMPITSSLISSALNAYKQTPEFAQEYAAYKAQNLIAIISGYAKKVFKTSKYNNLIELTVKEDDSMVNPLSMNIGQIVEIIHEGVSYNSILTGKEIKNGIVKLTFGTIRLELTKILNMKGV